MLGNFSFGGYFKKDAIKYAYDFITKEMGLEIDYVSVFKGHEGDPSEPFTASIPADVESEEIWKKVDPSLTIKKFGRADNFWGPTGDEGPCGPTSEIYIKNADGKSVEVWNIVFNQYFQSKDGKLKSLETPGIDTGMGLERLAMMVQNKKNIFETDLFEPIINKLPEKIDLKTKRIIADHLRAATFIISDNIKPGKDERNYIPRLLIRRAMLADYLYISAGLNLLFYERIVDTIIELYKFYYPCLKEKKKEILSIFHYESVLYEKPLHGIISELKKIYNKFISGIDPEKKIPSVIIEGNKVDIDGNILFRIRETYGANYEVMRMVMEKWGFIFSKKTLEEYNEAYKKHQELSRTASAGMFKGGLADASVETTRLHTAAHLMLEALRRTLGDHVHQKGSNITSERLRFDFSHPEKVTPEQLAQVEKIVNEQIEKKLPVHFEEMSVDEAKKLGATGVFEHKYGDKVKVYFVGEKRNYFSKEICGGPHVSNTSELGRFKIIKEESASAGVRRIKAILQ
jgi:alanyl-tRNA synthetase